MDKEKCLAIIQEIFSTNRYVIHSGIIIDEVGCGWAKLHMTIDPDVHINLTGFTHGGAFSTLANTAVGVACCTVGAKTVTLNITRRGNSMGRSESPAPGPKDHRPRLENLRRPPLAALPDHGDHVRQRR